MPGVVDELGLGFAVVGDAGKVISACKRYAAMVGRPQDEVIGLTLDECTHPDDLAAVRLVIGFARSHGEVADIRKRYLRPDGSILWVEQRLLLLAGANRRTLLVTVHPVKCPPGDGQAPAGQRGLSDYVADMSAQLSDMAKAAALPVTCDLLEVASRTADHEGGEGRTREARARR